MQMRQLIARVVQDLQCGNDAVRQRYFVDAL